MNALVGTAESWIALSIVRSLGRKGIKLDCASDSIDALSFHSKHCSSRYHYPEPKDEKAFIDAVVTLLEGGDYILPYFTNENTLLPISANRKKIEAHTTLPLPSMKSMDIASDKAQTMAYAEKIGIPTPKTRFPRSLDDAVDLADDIGYPVVLKPRKSSNAKGIFYCKDEAELRSGWAEVVKEFTDPILQEYIPQGGEAMGLEALYNENSQSSASFIHKRIREYPLSGGPSTLRESIKDPLIGELGLKMLDALKWNGVAMVEFKVDPRDGQPKLMEINPRFWGSLPLSIAAGVDFPYLLYKMVQDGDIEPVDDYKVGVRCRNLPLDIRHMWHVLMHGPTSTGPGRLGTAASFARFYGKDLHYDIASFSDPGPMAFEFREILKRNLLGGKE